ncbi:hypothetical protein RRG08_016674 [Elysia crispata]|uniref:Uncharacterized protein n=1 Tax=Elysia crispata TaxID=231223 RepID=A0AAE0XSG8_9GAST|nr:hypothetical protein RRG08_016674 [Elysia crispata]
MNEQLTLICVVRIEPRCQEHLTAGRGMLLLGPGRQNWTVLNRLVHCGLLELAVRHNATRPVRCLVGGELMKFRASHLREKIRTAFPTSLWHRLPTNVLGWMITLYQGRIAIPYTVLSWSSEAQ